MLRERQTDSVLGETFLLAGSPCPAAVPWVPACGTGERHATHWITLSSSDSCSYLFHPPWERVFKHFIGAYWVKAKDPGSRFRSCALGSVDTAVCEQWPHSPNLQSPALANCTFPPSLPENPFFQTIWRDSASHREDQGCTLSGQDTREHGHLPAAYTKALGYAEVSPRS